jgi:hypothetical protein
MKKEVAKSMSSTRKMTQIRALFRSQRHPALFQPHIGQGQAADPGV